MTHPVFKENVHLKDYCTFGIGGPARYFFEVRKKDEMVDVLKYCRDEAIPYMILGKGSNSLFDDRGFNGAVILNKIDFFEQPNPGTFHVGAGYNFSLLGVQTARLGWGGLEFASGIPGSVGGAVYMNAGANGGETFDNLESVDYLNEDGTFETLLKNEITFSYRTSMFQKKKGAIIGATFSLTAHAEARKKQIEIVNYRIKTQPYGDKSAGCVFVNPACGGAGALIDQSGLKGLSVGGAEVSKIHANFLINANQATCSDMLSLISQVKARVKETAGVDLKTEVRYFPYDQETS